MSIFKDQKAKDFWSKQILILIDNFVRQIRSNEEDRHNNDDNKDNNNHESENEERIIKFLTEYQMKVNVLMEELGVKVYLYKINRKINNIIILVRLNSSAYVSFYN